MTTHGSTVVVGGSGAVGSLLVSLLRGDGDDVTVVDVAGVDLAGVDLAGVDVAAGSGPDASALRGDIVDPAENVRIVLGAASTVILAVPEHIALAADLRAVNADALVVETLSVKTRIARVLGARQTGSAMGINPMFAPSLGMSGRPVAVVSHRDGVGQGEFLARLERWGGSLVHVDADRHDRLAAATQALTHASVLSFGAALSALDLSIDDIAAIAPPPHATSLALLARIAAGEPEVYWDVQSGNPYAQQARSALVAASIQLDEAVKSGSEDRFGEFVGRAGGALGGRGPSYERLCGELFGIVRGTTDRA